MIDIWKIRDDIIGVISQKIEHTESFRLIGDYYFKIFTDNCKIKDHHKILDIGCGRGRLAIPLSSFLKSDGEYHGFDVIKKDIDWCMKNLASRHENFFFKHTNVFNSVYFPQGKTNGASYTFPYESNYFDFVFLISVFTHTLPLDLERYISEISRVLKTGGMCISTFYFLDNLDGVVPEKSRLDFKYKKDGYRTISVEKPEAAVGYSEYKIRNILKKYNFEMAEPIHYGKWRSEKNSLDHQDHIIFSKI